MRGKGRPYYYPVNKQQGVGKVLVTQRKGTATVAHPNIKLFHRHNKPKPLEKGLCNSHRYLFSLILSIRIGKIVLHNGRHG